MIPNNTKGKMAGLGIKVVKETNPISNRIRINLK